MRWRQPGMGGDLLIRQHASHARAKPPIPGENARAETGRQHESESELTVARRCITRR